MEDFYYQIMWLMNDKYLTVQQISISPSEEYKTYNLGELEMTRCVLNFFLNVNGNRCVAKEMHML